MTVIFLGLMYSEKSLKDAKANSKRGLQMAPHNFQTTLIKGFEQLEDADVTVLNISPVGSYPHNYKKIFIGREVWGRNNIQIGYINLPVIKRFEQEVKIKVSVAGKRVVQHSLYPEIYGVSFLQMWTDQHGTDNLESKMPGYIFLMIDFKENENQPIIHVRTWQPQDNIKSPKDKYNLMDFRVYEFTE